MTDAIHRAFEDPFYKVTVFANATDDIHIGIGTSRLLGNPGTCIVGTGTGPDLINYAYSTPLWSFCIKGLKK